MLHFGWTVVNMTESKTLKRWESALLLALGLFLAVGVWLNAAHAALAGDVLRLHVLANSDSEEDQALKLAVRDRVLAEAAGYLASVGDRAQAETVLSGALESLAQAGAEAVAEAGYSYPVAVSLENAWFPTKEYGGFSLPAGEYRALRVVIGAGEGHNWWCVVFPPLCLGAVSQPAAEAVNALPQGERALITGENEGYVIKFKLMELWDEWRRGLRW